MAGARGTLAAKIKLAGNQPSGIWLDHTGTIFGGSDNSGRRGLEAQLSGALRHAVKEPVLSNIGLQRYEQDYINPIARILTNDVDLDAFSRLPVSAFSHLYAA